jgi:tetratricopeptide (TPR) repeat protein
LGDNKSAQEEVDNMKEVKKIFPENHFAASYALIAMPVRMALENKDWEQATNLELPSIEFPWENLAWEKAMLHFGKALGYAHLKNINAAEAELKTLKNLHQSLLNSNDNHAKTYKAGQVNIQVKTIEGWIALVKGNKEEALKSMRMAVDLESKTSKHPVTPGEVLPADELLGDMLLALNLPQEALEAYEVNLLGHPNRFNGIYGAAIAAKKAGNTEKATRYFQQLIDLAKGIDSNRPELVEAKDYVS